MTELPLLIEGAVSLLLFITVGYCIVLERRMRAFRGSQEHLRALISELDAATKRAEQTVLGLGETTREAEAALERRLREARSLTRSLALLSAAPANTKGRTSPRRAVRGPKGASGTDGTTDAVVGRP